MKNIITAEKFIIFAFLKEKNTRKSVVGGGGFRV